MPGWEHVNCGNVYATRVPPPSCEWCDLLGSTEHAGWRRVGVMTKAQKKAIAKRNRKKRGKIGKKKRERIYDRDERRCVRCGEEDEDELTLDHVIPISRGGTDEDANLQTMCKRCNGLKGNKTGSNGMRWPPDREMRRAGLIR